MGIMILGDLVFRSHGGDVAPPCAAEAAKPAASRSAAVPAESARRLVSIQEVAKLIVGLAQDPAAAALQDFARALVALRATIFSFLSGSSHAREPFPALSAVPLAVGARLSLGSSSSFAALSITT